MLEMPIRTRRRRRFRGGFTLTEMLVVLSIILIVLLMILAGGLSARKAAQQTMCLTRLRDIGLAVINYSHRYDGTLPLASWADLAPAAGHPTESPLSVRGFGTLRGNPDELYGPGVRPLPTARDVLQAFMNTKEPVWKCSQQSELKGPVAFGFTEMTYVDDERGFRPGYRLMSTVDMRAYVRSPDAGVMSAGKLIMAEEMLVRNVGGLKYNRIKTVNVGAAAISGGGGSAAIVVAVDSSPAFHSKDGLEWHQMSDDDPRVLRVHMVYLDGHAEQHDVKGRAGYLALFHGPVRQRFAGADFETEFPKYYSSRSEVRP